MVLDVVPQPGEALLRRVEQEGCRVPLRTCAVTPGDIREAIYAACVARQMPAGRPPTIELAGAAVLGWGAQLDQSNLPGTCASSSTR